jgi:hypothetical protein
MHQLFILICCVNTAWYIHVGLHRVTIHIHMFPKSHELSKSVNISQRYNKANLTGISGYLDCITVSRIYTPADRVRQVWTEMLVTCIARLCAELCASTKVEYVFKWRSLSW